MKKAFLFFVLVILFKAGYCEDTIPAHIIFYREYNFQGAALDYKIYSGESLVGKLKNTSWFSYYCMPGETEFHVNNSRENQLRLDLKAGRTYYCRFNIRMGFWTAVPELILVDSISAYPAIHNTGMKETNGVTFNLVRPKNRLGLNMILGLSMENVPMVILINGDESVVGFGGGFGIGASYGYEISKHFDLVMDLNYQFSDLRPYVKNASASFGRGTLSLTPYYIIPISDGDAMRIRLGGGVAGYFSPKLTIKTSALTGGFNDNWSYGNSLGYHLCASYEVNFSDRWSALYGLKYYNVNYSFEKSENTLPTDNRLKNPDGSGFDLIISMFFNF